MNRNRKEYLFIDGYNIINAWKNLKSISEISLDAARNELIEIMAEYQSFTGIEIIIVFDAHLLKGSNEKKEKIYNITVVYTKERETADGYIEKKLDAIGRNKTVRVATSDWLEQQVILGRGGTRISARELKIEVDDIKKAIERKRKKDEESNKNENNSLRSRLDKEILEKFEKIRRNQ